MDTIQETKQCSTCKQEKSLDLFYKGQDSFCKTYDCKECIKEMMRKRFKQKQVEKVNIILPDEKRCSKCEKLKLAKFFNKDCTTSDGLRVWCKECLKWIQKGYHNKNKKTVKIMPPVKKCSRCKERKDSIKFGVSRSSKDGLDYICKKCKREIFVRNINKTRIQARNRRSRDVIFRLSTNLRRRMLLAIKGQSKSAQSMKLLGISGKDCLEHLKSLFWPGMSLDNYGKDGWVIDHIIPVNSFDKTDPDWQFKAFHYTNLQPLWFKDNSTKFSRLDWTPAESTYELPDRFKHYNSTQPQQSQASNTV